MEPIDPSADHASQGGGAFHYAGVVVIVAPGCLEACARRLDALAGVEVHHRHPETRRIVVVLESRTAEEHLQILQRVQTVPDVTVAAPVYHYVDNGSDAPELEAEERDEQRHLP